MRRTRIKYSQDELDFLIVNTHIMRRDLTKMFNDKFNRNLSRDNIKSKCTRMGLKTGRKAGRPKGMLLHNSYTPEQVGFLRKNKTLVRVELTALFNLKFITNRTIKAIEAKCKQLNLKTGRTGRYEKGNVPASKGTKGVYGVHPNSRKTQFKKGRTPANAKPLGYRRKTADEYWEVLIDETNPHTGYPRRFVLEHRQLWQKHNGTIPPGHKIIFKDSNKNNVTIENLKMVTDGEMARLNTMKYKQAPPQVKPTLRKIAKLQTKISEVSK